MKNWISMLNVGADELTKLLDLAQELKGGAPAKAIPGKTLGLLFFNQSLRTRMSFEAVMGRYGGTAIILAPGTDVWGIEIEEGVVMNQDKAEHVVEAAQVVSRYCDCLGMRSFGALDDRATDEADKVIRAFARYATVPVVNLESAMEHPCQALADMLTIREKLPDYRNKKFVLSWAPHIKPLPLAVPHSALVAAANLGMNVTLTHPKGYDLSPHIRDSVEKLCEANAAEFSYTEDQRQATEDADVLYVKSWGSPDMYGDLQKQSEDFRRHSDWCVTNDHLAENTSLMHCLPVRRNVVIADEVLNGKQSVVIDQAENRMWAQAAILETIFSSR